jgi:sec-independent protein translocase protein TatA
VEFVIHSAEGTEYLSSHLNDESEIIMVGEIFGMDGFIVLIAVVALLFGGTAIPKLARSLGSAKNEFEKGLSETKPVEPTAHVVDSQ